MPKNCLLAICHLFVIHSWAMGFRLKGLDHPFRKSILWWALTDTSVDTSIEISVDVSIDTLLILGPYMVDMSTECRSTINRYIGRHISLYVCTHVGCYSWYFTDTSPILYQYFIVTSPSISVNISVATRSIPRSVLYRYDILPIHKQRLIVGWYLNQFRTSIGRCLDRYSVDKEPL